MSLTECMMSLTESMI